MTDYRQQTLGVILAGGLARRMGGVDKCLLEVGGETILSRVLRRLGDQCARVVLNANGDPARFREFGVAVVADTVAGNPGPLGGILAGLEWARAHAPDCTHVVSAAGDTPFLPSDLVARLYTAARERGTPLAVACSREGDRMRAHPVFGLWPVALADALRAAIVEAEIRKILDWTDATGCARAEFPNTGVDPFLNINTPDDHHRAERAWVEAGAY